MKSVLKIAIPVRHTLWAVLGMLCFMLMAFFQCGEAYSCSPKHLLSTAALSEQLPLQPLPVSENNSPWSLRGSSSVVRGAVQHSRRTDEQFDTPHVGEAVAQNILSMLKTSSAEDVFCSIKSYFSYQNYLSRALPVRAGPDFC